MAAWHQLALGDGEQTPKMDLFSPHLTDQSELPCQDTIIVFQCQPNFAQTPKQSFQLRGKCLIHLSETAIFIASDKWHRRSNESINYWWFCNWKIFHLRDHRQRRMTEWQNHPLKFPKALCSHRSLRLKLITIFMFPFWAQMRVIAQAKEIRRHHGCKNHQIWNMPRQGMGRIISNAQLLSSEGNERYAKSSSHLSRHQSLSPPPA